MKLTSEQRANIKHSLWRGLFLVIALTAYVALRHYLGLGS